MANLSKDNIKYAREDRLHKELSSMSYKRDRLLSQIKREKLDDVLAERLLSLETDICYVFRELEHRQSRRDAHQNFMQSKSKKSFANRANRRRNVV